MRRILSALACLLIAAAVLVSWGGMALAVTDNGRLSAPGLWSLKYFTVLSNLLCAASSLLWALWRLLRRGEPPRWLCLLKLAGVASVALTLLTVLIFLGPLYGYRDMFSGVNFWLHLLVPAAALLEYLLLSGVPAPTLRGSLAAILPVGLYGTVYLLNILLHGLGDEPFARDIYGFCQWGLPVGGLIFLALVALTWGMALLLRAARLRMQKHRL